MVECGLQQGAQCPGMCDARRRAESRLTGGPTGDINTVEQQDYVRAVGRANNPSPNHNSALAARDADSMLSAKTGRIARAHPSRCALNTP